MSDFFVLLVNMKEKRLKIGFISNNANGKTGLGRNIKALLPILYKKDKWDIHMLNQGMGDNDANYQRFPWKNEGAIKNFDQQRFHADQNYQRFVAYGGTAVADFVIKNQLDCVIALDDPWAFPAEAYFKTDWYQNIKQNFFPILTIDSEPVLPLIKEWAENNQNLHFWASFGERLLKEENFEKYKHVKTMYPAFNIESFKPLLEVERQELRKQNNISKDEKIIIYIFRNQLRKLAWAEMEALAKFKKQNPISKKTRLLFHTSFSEGAGWPLDQIRQELGLDREDILATYFCVNCGNWEIKPFDGEFKDCKFCGAKGCPPTQHNQRGDGQKTAGIDSTIDEENLNKIYNLADGACSCATSGGSELFSQESMLAGIPFSSFPYSCGEDYVKNDFVFSLKGTYTRECGTSFKKFVPDINSIVKFYDFIWNLTIDQKKKITREARQWTIDNFEAHNIANKYEKIFDSCKPIDWKPFIEKKKELKNPNAQIQDAQDDAEFVRQCYKEILANPNVEETDKSGFNHWMNFLKQSTDKAKLKNDMVTVFRNAAASHNQQNNPMPFDIQLDNNDKSRILLVLKQSFGDHYILTSLLPEIQKKYPESSIYIGCEEKYFPIYEGNQYVKKCLPWINEFNNEMWATGFGAHKGFFNTYINIGLSTQLTLNYLTNDY